MIYSRLFKKDYENIFRFKANPYFWREKAKELKFAAEIIWPHAENRLHTLNENIRNNPTGFNILDLEPDTFPIFLSLIGFSTECLFKATIIKNNPSFISP